MSVRQLRPATYYDKKVAEEELQVDEIVAHEIDFGTKSQWLTRDKLKGAPKNSEFASPFINEQDPKPSETSNITDTVSSEFEDEMILEGDNIADQQIICYHFYMSDPF